MLGIIIGIAAVLAMIAIGDGAKEVVMQDVQKVGVVQPDLLCTKPHINEKTADGFRIRSNEYMEYEDVRAIEAECPSVSAVTPRNCGLARCNCFRVPGGTEASRRL